MKLIQSIRPRLISCMDIIIEILYFLNNDDKIKLICIIQCKKVNNELLSKILMHQDHLKCAMLNYSNNIWYSMFCLRINELKYNHDYTIKNLFDEYEVYNLLMMNRSYKTCMYN